MKKIIYLSLLVLLVGCTSPLKRSIFEPLSVEELSKEFKKDSLFEGTYKRIKYINDTVLKSELDKVKWSELTYNRIQDYVKYQNDTNVFNGKVDLFSKVWNEKFGIYYEKVDSVLNYWKEYKEKNSLEQYIKIELVEIYKERYSYSNDIKNINLGFKLTPLQGNVDQVRFGYKIKPKLDEGKEESYLSVFDLSWCIMSSPIYKSTIKYWEASYENEKILETRTLSSFLRDYNIFIEIDELRKNGINYDSDDIKIPQCVEMYWSYDEEHYMKRFYRDDIIKELIFPAFVTDYDYLIQETNKILMKKDQLVFDYLAMYDKY